MGKTTTYTEAFFCSAQCCWHPVDILILSPVQNNRLPLSAPRGQVLIFLWSTCCSGLLRLCKPGWRREVREYVTPPISMNRQTPHYTRTCTWQSPLITQLCSLWVSTDKQCVDQRPLIVFRGRVMGDKERSVSGKDWKRIGLSTLETGTKRGKHIRTKAFSLPAVA